MTRSLRQRSVKVNTTTVLNGPRGIRHPFIALMTRRSMGPERHVLSQKVVAGTMTVHPPFISDQPTIS